jgi:hypothetical protein
VFGFNSFDFCAFNRACQSIVQVPRRIIILIVIGGGGGGGGITICFTICYLS